MFNSVTAGASIPYAVQHSNVYYQHEQQQHVSVGAWNGQAASAFSNVWDYYANGAPTHVDHYNTYPGLAPRYDHSTGTPSPHSTDAWPSPITSAEAYYNGHQLDGSALYQYQPPKKRNTNNKKERRRTVSINGAFGSLRDCIPNVPKDTKLSKIKTLRLAVAYMNYLMDILNSDSAQPITEFKADLSRKTERRADKRKCIEAEIAAAEARKARGRTGWPQTIWASDLKGEGPCSKFSAQPTSDQQVESPAPSLYNDDSSSDSQDSIAATPCDFNTPILTTAASSCSNAFGIAEVVQ